MPLPSHQGIKWFSELTKVIKHYAKPKSNSGAIPLLQQHYLDGLGVLGILLKILLDCQSVYSGIVDYLLRYFLGHILVIRHITFFAIVYLMLVNPPAKHSDKLGLKFQFPISSVSGG